MIFWAIAMAAQLAAAPVAEIDHAIDAGRFDQARLMIANAIQAGAPAATLEPEMAKLAYRSGAHAEALARYEALLAAKPGDATLSEQVGLAALALGLDEKALAALARATAAPSASWRAWNALGVLADRGQDFAEARASYAKAQALAPSRPEILNNLGWSYFLEGRPAEALPYLERAMAADGHVKLYAANVEVAKAAIAADLPPRRQGESADDYAARLNDAGVVALSQKQKRKAIAAFSQAIAVHGDYYERAANNLKMAESAK
jgi:Flp pilus assembly protein TadD